MATIKTLKFDEMVAFYRGTLQLHEVVGDFTRSAWFKDFKTEIHIDEVSDPNDVGVLGDLILFASDVAGVAQMFNTKRGLPIELRKQESGLVALLQDPDGNLLLIKEVPIK